MQRWVLAFSAVVALTMNGASMAQPARPQKVAAVDAQETAKLHALFDAQWQAVMRNAPEFATYRGDLRYNDQLSDVSQEAIERNDAQVRDFLAQARAIRRDALAPVDRTSLDMFIGERERSVAQQQFPGLRTLRIGVLGGAQTGFANLMRAVPMRTAQQARQLLARMDAYPRQMAQEIALMRRGIAAGWVPGKDVMARGLMQLDGVLNAELDTSPFVEPFRRLPPEVPQAERDALLAEGRAAVQGKVLPALRQLRAFVVSDYQPKSPASGALLGYPDGPKVYEMLVRQQTTTRLTAQEIHAIGLREMARLHAGMEAVRVQTGFNGDFAAFVEYVNTDAKFFHAGPQALLAAYQSLAKRIDEQLPRFFAELPRAPYGVRAMPAYLGPDAAEFYDAPARDGTRPGYFNANIEGWRKKPVWSMASLTLHEAVPGHHLQIARATELTGLPEFRRGGGYVAFSEGWALYAETLGNEMGLYDDPYSRFGHLQDQGWRAARLVVDTGIHALGWTRQQAIDYMVDQVGLDRGIASSEIDRYTATPGQALGYMVGALRIVELRDRAKARLGSRFDLRRFHNAVIDQGALPLDILEHIIDEWIAAEAARP